MPAKPQHESLPPGLTLRRSFRVKFPQRKGSANRERIVQIAWSHDGRRIALVCSDRTLRVRDVESGQEQLVHAAETEEDAPKQIVWAPDGELLAACCGDGSVRFWKTATGEFHQNVKSTLHVSNLAWTPDARTLAVSGGSGEVQLWEAGSWKAVSRLDLDRGSAWRLAWAATGKMLAISLGEEIWLWNTKSDHVDRRFRGYVGTARSIAWQPGRPVLASASWKLFHAADTLILWDTKSGERQQTLAWQGGNESATGVAFSADGSFLAFKTSAAVRLWRCDTWEQIALFAEPADLAGISANLSFHPTAPILATLGGDDRIVRLWDLDPRALTGGDEPAAAPAAAAESVSPVRRPSPVDDPSHWILRLPKLSLDIKEPLLPPLPPPPAFHKHTVFLCHNSLDKPAVKEIGQRLRARGIVPWLDEWELRPGFSWQELLEAQIESISSAAVFIGREGLGPWQQREMRSFLNEFVERGCPVIPVLLADAPQEPKLPIFLKGHTWVDFRKTDPEPLDRLIWGITGQRA